MKIDHPSFERIWTFSRFLWKLWKIFKLVYLALCRAVRNFLPKHCFFLVSPTKSIECALKKETSDLKWRGFHYGDIHYILHQFSSVAQSCPTLCNPMNHSTPGLPVHHQLPEFSQTHVHRVSDAIQPSHPLSSHSPHAPNPSQHQSFPMSQLFTWGGQSTGV